jgi:hypothetical protein
LAGQIGRRVAGIEHDDIDVLAEGMQLAEESLLRFGGGF